ncbi:MAG: flagellar export chaperone FliS [Limnochordia bacterium]|jgi:flagellar protein FliS
MNVHAYNMYRKTQVETASQLDLILMLYNGAIKYARWAREMIDQGRVEEAHNYLVRVQDIVDELNLGLNMDQGGQIASSLAQLYDYVNHCLIEANLRKVGEPIDEAIHILSQLKDTWAQLAGGSRGGEG